MTITKQEFEEKQNLMLDAYFEIEKQFRDAIRIIPLYNKPETYSPVLYNILQNSCGQVENILRLICDYLELEYEKKNFPTYFNLINNDGVLKRQTVAINLIDRAYRPFWIMDGEETPKWWQEYNKTKHDLPKGFEYGNLENTVLSLSANYSLQCLAPTVKNYGKEALNNKKWHDDDSISMTSNKEFYQGDLISFIPRSKIFYCLSFYMDARF